MLPEGSQTAIGTEARLWRLIKLKQRLCGPRKTQGGVQSDFAEKKAKA